MYLVKRPLKNNGKDYKPGDYIESQRLSETDLKSLLNLGVISTAETKPQISSNPPEARVAITDTPTTEQQVLGFVNSADIKELTKIKGVGEVTAKAIASHRETNGLFSSIEELDKLIPAVDWNNVTYDS